MLRRIGFGPEPPEVFGYWCWVSPWLQRPPKTPGILRDYLSNILSQGWYPEGKGVYSQAP